MNDRNLNRAANSISGIVDDLVSQIENLESEIEAKDAGIESLKEQLENAIQNNSHLNK